MTNRNWIRWFAALLLMLTLSPVAAAAQTGSLQLQEIQHPACVYLVADASGAFADAFSGCSLELPFSDPVKAAAALEDYALRQGIAGQSLTPRNGEATFGPLEKGTYLVCSQQEPGEFAPFLLQIPTALEGRPIYQIQAKPKQEDTPPDNTTLPPSTTPDDTKIPQTGTSVIPRCVLMVLGSALTLAGLYDVIRGREDGAHE